MAYDGSLTFDTKIDASGFNEGTSSLSKQAGGLKNVLSSLGKTVAKVFAVTQLIKFGKEAVNLASNIQEVQNVVDTAFGDMKYKMEAFAESAIEMYGISKLTAKETGSTFMAMAKGLGLAEESASNISLQLTALSADMSSFYNKTQDITSTALKSVFTGETETLKQFGIVMTEANLEAFRLAQGIETSYKKMSQAEKVALRYNYVMQQTKLAQGDFEKTQNSWANQTRILSERWKEFLGILGNGLVKVLTPIVRVLNTALQYLIGFANVIGQLLGGETKQQEAITESISGAVDKQNELTEATKETEKANSKTLASFDEIQKLTGSSDDSASSSSGVGFDVATPYNFDFDTKNVESKLGNVKIKLEELKQTIQTLIKGLKPTIDLLVKIWDDAWKTVRDGWQKWGDPIFKNVREAIKNIGEIWKSAWEKFLQPIWQNFMNMIDWLWIEHLQPLLANFIDFIGELVNGALEIYNKVIAPIVKWLVELLGPIVANVINTIINMAGYVLAVVIDVINGIITTLKGIVQFIVGVFTGDWEKAWEGVKNIFKGIWDAVGGIVKGAINLIIDLINGMLSALEKALNWIVDKINSLEITNPFTGDEIWSPNIPRFNFGRIPKLATGTVVPSNNGEFLAMLGDNKRETEIVSPLSTMKQAFIEALAESGQNITIKFEESSIGDLVRLLKPYIDKENRRVGSSTRVTGGAY